MQENYQFKLPCPASEVIMSKSLKLQASEWHYRVEKVVLLILALNIKY